MPVDLPLRIRSHEDLGASHFLLTLEPPPGSSPLPPWEPGQFAMLSVTAETAGRLDDPLLRRPFSIFNRPDSPEGCLQIFYKVLGRGTELLSRARVGDAVRCLAPLGNGFTRTVKRDDRLLLVAGGIGSASLHPLALHHRRDGPSPLFLYGCRSRDELAGARPTQEAGIEVRISTDDGTAGRAGLVTELLEEILAAGPPETGGRWIVCACGPTPMMKATAAAAARRDVTCYLSLESPMACGFGVCVGCVVGTRRETDEITRYRRICIDGPVFDAATVIW